jgi:xyloglucan-specific endo-beta-1,4-glucanase
MRFTHALLPVILSSSALTSPTAILDKRAETFCGQWDLVETGTYTLYNNVSVL